MISGLLDLDLKESWHSDFKDLVYSQEVWHQVEAKFATGQEQGSSFLSQFTYADDSLDDHLVRFLRQNVREILLARYSHVAGYHGCRQKDPTSYTSTRSGRWDGYLLPSCNNSQYGVYCRALDCKCF
jgi:hypothetical protein